MTSTRAAAFRRGLLDGLPFMLTGLPFGLVYGLVAVEAGLDHLQAFTMSLVVFGGASQFAALAQLTDGAPALMAVAAGLMVNLRMAIYSASLTPYLGAAPLWKRAVASYLLVDNSFVTSSAEFTRNPKMSLSDRYTYYFATSAPVCITWILATVAGILGGRAIPGSIGIEFAVPLTFLALVGPMIRTLAHLAAAVTAVVTVIVLSAMPYNSELILGGFLGMFAGAEVERRRGR